MPKEKQLNVEKRDIIGRKVKNLRKQGILPANVYGSKVDSLSIQLPTDAFIDVFEESGETELITLKVKSEKKDRPVLVRNMQLHPVTNQVLHVDFLQVDLTVETTATVPLEYVGESPAVKEEKGILLELMTEIDVSCLPADIPSKIKVDITGLNEVNDAIALKDIKLPAKVKIEADPDELVCKIEAEQLEEEVEEAPVEEELAEGEEAAEGQPEQAKEAEAAQADGEGETEE